MSIKLRLAFMGTPAFSVPILDALVAAGHDIAAVYSQPARPTGRGHHAQPSPVEARAQTLGLERRTPHQLKSPEEQEAFAALGLDAAVVAAYGLILPRAILAAPRLGCLNIHASLLPRWRGAAPIQRAILAGDAVTGVTIMQMAPGLDTGPMLLKAETPITPDTDSAGLHDILSQLGAELILPALEGVASGRLIGQPQDEAQANYATKLDRAEAALDWTRPAPLLERQIRAFTPWPGAYFDFGAERIKILAASIEAGPGDLPPPGTIIDDNFGIACGEGVFRPTRLQRPGRAVLGRRAFLNGLALPAGTVLGRAAL